MTTQLIGSLIVAVLIPYVIRVATLGVADDIAIVNVTAFGAVAAILGSVWIYRNIYTYPGAEMGSYIIPANLIAFGTLFAVFLITRLEYSRVLLMAAIVLSLAWNYFVALKAQAEQRLVIGILPLGQARDLMSYPTVDWTLIRDHQDSGEQYDAIATDLRIDLPDAWERKLADYALGGVAVLHYKHLKESLSGRVELEHLYESSSGSLLPNPAYLKIKSAIDWVAALIFVIAALPFLCIVALLIKLSSPGPAFFTQPRIGYQGKPFTVYKFRTMRHRTPEEIEQESVDAVITRENDDRITPIGRILRKTRIDELPQVLNILLGQMSWIGPRPEAAMLSQSYDRKIAFYRYRHVVRPGITGWAQVSQGHVTDLDDIRYKLHYDFYYIKYFSPWLDMLILAKTIWVVISGKGAK
ncbi:MAG: sugar transferase [Erythrobacter sp.]